MKYINQLHNADDNVMSVSPQIDKQTRPFVGVIVIMNGKNYCIPLTSPKEKFDKKSNIDFIKILDEKTKNKNGAPKIIGVLNINNMIPVNKEVIEIIDLKSSENDPQNIKQRKSLMQDQLKWCRDHSATIINRANKVYDLVVNNPNKNRNLTRRCCDFTKLEKVLEKYLGRSDSMEAVKAERDRAVAGCNKMAETINRTNAILNANPKLKAEFVEAKKKFEKAEEKNKGKQTPDIPSKPKKPKR